MCLGVPGRVVALTTPEVAPDALPGGALPMATVDFGGVRRDVCVLHVPHVRVGDHVLVHVGFALTVLDEIEATKILDTLRELAALQEEPA